MFEVVLNCVIIEIRLFMYLFMLLLFVYFIILVWRYFGWIVNFLILEFSFFRLMIMV